MLTDSQILALCSELNHILWTEDTPDLGSEISESLSQHESVLHQPKGNMQCRAHAVVCAALTSRMGEKVTTRAGSALIVYPEQQKQEKAFFVAKHWWISTATGLFDLSLNLSGISAHKPIIYQNKNLVGPYWRVVFKDDFERIVDESSKSHKEGISGIFYQTDKKILVTKGILEPDLLKEFTPAKEIGISLKYLDIVNHCERLLNGGESLVHLQQKTIWHTLGTRILASNG